MKDPIRPKENQECNQSRDVKGEKSDIDGMDEGYAEESENETQAQESSEAAMSEDVAAGDPGAEEVIHAEEAETQAPRVPRAPRTPSQQEIDDHEVTHCPFRSWCEHCVRGQAKDDPHCAVSAPAEPMPGSTTRPKHRLVAYAKRIPDERVTTSTYVPAAEPADVPECRAAKIFQRDIEAFGGSEKCPGCKAAKSGKYKMSHTFECRQRFEKLLKEDVRAKQRFERAAERRLTGITNRAMAMDPTAPSNTPTVLPAEAGGAEVRADTTPAASASSGSGLGPLGDPRRVKGIDEQNAKQLQEGIKASMQVTESTARGTKRDAEEEADDYERASRETTADTKGVKRKDDDQDDSQRKQDRADDMSSLQSDRKSHPGPVHREKKFNKEDLEWNHIGSGMFARTFVNADHMITTSKSGPPMMDIHRRIIRSLSTGKVLDDCIVDEVSDEELHRPLKQPDNIRVELIMKGALKLFNTKGPDVCEIYSQPRIAQEAGLQGRLRMKPGWSLDLTLDDPRGTSGKVT